MNIVIDVCHTVLWVEIVLEALCIISNIGSNKPGSAPV